MIGIIGFESLRVMQYLDKYTQILDDEQIPYEVIYWNRSGADHLDPRFLPYEKEINSYVPFLKKMKYFFGYAWFLYRTIHKRGYKNLIVLTTQTAVTLSPLLLTSYRYHYLYDYRDITFEKNRIFRSLVRLLFRQSTGVPISSLGFSKIIGNSDKYQMSHNTSDFEQRTISKTPSKVIRIVYWGMVRQVAFNKKICDLFGNDDRFTLAYHGEGYTQELQDHCQKIGYQNISFTGGYERDEIDRFAAETDILLNAYENDRQQQPALTVKMYEGMRYEIPQLVTPGSYMEEFLSGLLCAFPLDLNQPSIKEAIIRWQWDTTQNEVDQSYQKLWEKLYHDEIQFNRLVVSFCKPKVILFKELKGRGVGK